MSGDTTQDAQRTWNRVAEAYAHRRGRSDATKPAHDWIVEQVDPQPGQVILDLAAGAGDLGHRIASMVSPGGRIICSDLAPGMVDVARTIGNERDLDSVEYRVMDAQHMDLDDGSVDAIVCSAALMLMPDPDAVFAEARRVLRPGGVLAFSVFTTAAENPWVSVPVRVFVERGTSTRLPAPAPACSPSATETSSATGLKLRDSTQPLSKGWITPPSGRTTTPSGR